MGTAAEAGEVSDHDEMLAHVTEAMFATTRADALAALSKAYGIPLPDEADKPRAAAPEPKPVGRKGWEFL